VFELSWSFGVLRASGENSWLSAALNSPPCLKPSAKSEEAQEPLGGPKVGRKKRAPPLQAQARPALYPWLACTPTKGAGGSRIHGQCLQAQQMALAANRLLGLPANLQPASMGCARALFFAGRVERVEIGLLAGLAIELAPSVSADCLLEPASGRCQLGGWILRG